MTRRLMVTVGMVSCVVCLAGAQLTLARSARSKVKAVRREMRERFKEPLPKDNSACMVCHLNLGDEELVVKHLPYGVTCMLCHGLCFEHRNDESSQTKPDVLFGRAEVKPFCRKCHEGHKHPKKVKAFLAEWEGKVRPNGRLILEQAICTDCHGTHIIRAVPIISADDM
ncbi:MAG: hypothetical protein ACE5R4_15935 [Armatimonadota bacterium]